MFKQAYRIGDDIVATCDFSESNVPCVQVSTVVSLLSLNLVLTLSSFALMGNSFLQYSVTLQSEEIVSETCRKKSSQGVTVNSYCKHNEFCLHTKKTHICLPIPLTATPGFITDVGTLCRLFVMIWLWFSFSDSAATSRFLNVLSLTICSNCKLFSESQVETALRIRHIKEATASASRADNKCRERPMAGPNSTGRGNHDLGPADQSFRNESFLCIKCITFEKWAQLSLMMCNCCIVQAVWIIFLLRFGIVLNTVAIWDENLCGEKWCFFNNSCFIDRI